MKRQFTYCHRGTTLSAEGRQAGGCRRPTRSPGRGGPGGLYGTSAVIRVQLAVGTDPETLKKRVAEILARYTVHYRVVFERSEGIK